MRVEVEDTYAEAFKGLFTRMIVTAKNASLLRKAAYNSTALPSVVIGRTEGGVERWLSSRETPDGREGAVVQFWGQYDEKNPRTLDRFYREVSYRIRQGILVVPTTSLFNAYASGGKLDMLERVGHCGDGYEWEEPYANRQVLKVPLMMGEFIIERYMGYGVGVSGGNVWFMCSSEDAALEAGNRAIEAIGKVEGVVTPFDVCSAGSKPETKFPEIGPTTNEFYCPGLMGRFPDSKIPEGVRSIPEIVINGVTLEAVREAMRAAILGVQDVAGVVRVSAGNYGGKLGEYRIPLRELVG